MADNKVVRDGVSSISNNIKNSVEATNASLNDVNNTLTNIAQDIGEGIKLTTKSSNEDKKTKLKVNLDNLKEQLNGLQVFAPDLAEMLNELLIINTTLLENDINLEKEATQITENPEELTDLDVNINTDSKEPKDLAGLTKLADIAGTGFSIVGNILKDLYTLFDTVLQGVAAGQIAQSLVASTAPITTNTVQEQAEQKNQEQSKNVLAGFFQGIAGPLESVAAGLLMISVAAAILQTIQISSELIGSIVILGTFVITTFAILNKIKATQQQNPDLLDTDGSKEGSMLNVVMNFSIMVGLTAGSLLLCSLLADTIVEKWAGILIGLALIFGTALITLAALNVIALAMTAFLGEESPIVTSVKEFSTLVLTISVVTILCALLEPIILSGLRAASLILLSTIVTFTILGVVLAKVGTTIEKDQLDAFNDILITTTVLIGIISLMVIVLGILPTSIVLQGMIAVTLLIGLVDIMFIMLGRTLQKLSSLSVAQLQQLTNILIATTVLIGIISVLTIVLGLLDTSVIIQGIVSIVIISAIPIILIEVMSRIANQSDKMLQAMIGVALAGILTVAVAGVAWVIISLLGGFEASQVLTTVLAVSLTTVLLFAVGAAGIGLAYLTPYLTMATGPALIGIGLASILSLAIAGIALLLTQVLSVETAKNAIIAAGAVTLTALALVTVGSATILLGALAIPLAVSSVFAISSLNILGRVVEAFIQILADILIPSAELLGSINLELLTNIVTAITGVLTGFVTLSNVLLTFNLIAISLIIQIGLATASLLSINIGIFIFIAQYNILALTLSNLNTSELNLANLTQNITELSAMSEVINSFVAPSIQSALAVNFAMNFAINFAKKIQQVGSDETVNRVVNLANSLANLASNANGLSNLAASIQAVAEATKNLNEVQTNSKISVEALTGQFNNQSEMMQKIEKNSTSEPDNTSQINAERIINLLENMSNEIQSMNGNLGAMTQNQTIALRRNESVSTRFME